MVKDDWNDAAVTAVEQDLADNSGQPAYEGNVVKAGQVYYQAGKVLAERAVLGFPEKYGGSAVLGWDVVSLVPSWVRNRPVLCTLFSPVTRPLG